LGTIIEAILIFAVVEIAFFNVGQSIWTSQMHFLPHEIAWKDKKLVVQNS
jgi:hypothetical protein